MAAGGAWRPRRSRDPSRNEKRIEIMANSSECAGYARWGQEEIDAGVPIGAFVLVAIGLPKSIRPAH